MSVFFKKVIEILDYNYNNISKFPMRAWRTLTSAGARAHIDTRHVVVNFLIYFKTEFLHFSARILLIRIRVLLSTGIPMRRHPGT